MTTLDDAAERRITEWAFSMQSNLGLPPHAGEPLKAWMRVVYQAATEAAAKKCDERAEKHSRKISTTDSIAEHEASNCAAAIRGKGG